MITIVSMDLILLATRAIYVSTRRNDLWISHSEQKLSTERQMKSDYLSKPGLMNTQTAEYGSQPVLIKNGKRYHIELDEIAPSEEDEE